MMGERVGGPGEPIHEIEEIVINVKSWWKRNISDPFNRNVTKPIGNFFSNLFSNAQNRFNVLGSKTGNIINTDPFEVDSKGRKVVNKGFTVDTAVKVAGTYSSVVYIATDEIDFTGTSNASRLFSSKVSTNNNDFYNQINNFTGGSSNSNYDILATALIFIPEEGFLTKGLKGVGKFGMCQKFASSFLKKYGGEKIIIDIGKGGILGTSTVQLSNNGYHEIVLKTINGVEYVFDNFHSKGILKSEYIKEINGYVNGKILYGEDIFLNYVK